MLRTTILSAVLTLPTFAAADGPGPDPPPAAQLAGYSFDPALELEGPFGPSTAGRFFSKDRTDAVVVRGTTPVYLRQPGVYTGQMAVGRPANDVATWVDPDGGVDGLVVVGEEGAFFLRLVPQGDGYVPQEETIGTGAWLDARRVAVGDFAGTGNPQVAAIRSDQSAVLIATRTEPGTWVSTSFALPQDGQQILALRWHDEAGPNSHKEQLAIGTSFGLRIFDGTGQLLHSRAHSMNDDHLVRLRGHNRVGSGPHLDAVAWFTPHPVQSGQHVLVVVGEDLLEPTLLLPQLHLEAAIGAPLRGGDDFDDLALVFRQAFSVRVFASSGPQTAPLGQQNASFDLSSSLVLPFHEQVPGEETPPRAVPVAGDFNGNGAIDLVLPVAQADWISFAAGHPAFPELPGGPCGNSGLVPRGENTFYYYCEPAAPAEPWARLDLVLDLPDLLPDEEPITHLEVRVYQAPCTTDAGGICLAEPTPVVLAFLPYTSLPAVTPPSGPPCAPALPAPDHTRRAVMLENFPPLPQLFDESGDPLPVFYISLRPVQMDGSEIELAGAPFLVVWAPEEDVTSFYPWVDEDWMEISLDGSQVNAKETCVPSPSINIGVIIDWPILEGKRLPVRQGQGQGN